MFTKLIWKIFFILNFLYRKRFFFLYIPLYIFYKNFSDRKIISIINNTLKEGDTVIDAGANIGYYTKLFSKLVGSSGRVISFEPDEMNFEILCNRTKKLDNVTVINAALSNYSGEIKLYLSKEFNVDHQTYPSDNSREFKVKNCYTLDNYLELNNIQKVNFIKMDLQGFDPIAYNGMIDTLKKNEDLVVQMEYWPWGIEKAGYDPQLWLNDIKSLNYNFEFEDPSVEFIQKPFNRMIYTTIWCKKK